MMKHIGIPYIIRANIIKTCIIKVALCFLFGAIFLSPSHAQTQDESSTDKLTIGVTLHPYYSFAINIVGDKANVVPLIDAGFNPHNYTPKPRDMKRIQDFDVLIVNGIGHDEWAFEVLEASGRKDSLALIYANENVALIPVADNNNDTKVVNPHTFVSTTAAIQQIYTIAKKLGELDKDNARFYRENARQYATKIRRMKAGFMTQLSELDLSGFRCATMHGAYGYLLQEFGLHVTAVIEPRHGVQPSARQLAKTIDAIKASGVNAMFAEKYFASKLSQTIQESTGVKLYAFSHISDGEFTAQKYEEEMRENLDTLTAAIKAVTSLPNSAD